MNIGNDFRPQRAHQVVFREIGGRMVLLKAPMSSMHTLNEVGKFLWSNIDGNRTVADLAKIVEENYETTIEQAQIDTLEFIAELAEKELVMEAS